MAMMVILAAVLLTYGVSPGIAMEDSSHNSQEYNNVYPLDMAEKSVDDMYDGCEKEMKKKAKEYLQNEKNTSKIFTEIWDNSMNNVHTPFWKWFTEVLNKKQKSAIRTYTTESDVYRDFNDAVRFQGPQYKTTFSYHALHFLLTTAIQDLRAKKNNQCLTVYRRVRVSFSQDVKEKSIRFGSFTSASWGDYANEGFGTKSCFEIFTCMGAEISSYSEFPGEREVLIPPYEVFKVVEIKKRSTEQPNLKCEVVYTVKSTGYVSKLNCDLVPK